LPTALYNRHPFFLRVNNYLNSLPGVNQLCAFHLMRLKKISNN
jgi:hypothetical protein